MLGVTTVTHVPSFFGQASSFANYEEKGTSRNRICPLGPQKHAANLFTHTTGVVRKVCMAAGRDVIDNNDGASHIFCILRERFAPDAIDSVFRILRDFCVSNRASRPWTRI